MGADGVEAVKSLALMISATDLRRLARERLKDARVLHRSRRHNGAAYICGYVIELALKARICRHLRWAGFPETKSEFDLSLKTHDLDVLLMLSGQERRIKRNFLAEWSAVAAWDPEVRYKAGVSATRSDVEAMIKAAAALLKTLCP